MTPGLCKCVRPKKNQRSRDREYIRNGGGNKTNLVCIQTTYPDEARQVCPFQKIKNFFEKQTECCRSRQYHQQCPQETQQHLSECTATALYLGAR